MAIVTRYFSTTGAGAADGTTWADRAELDPSGAWSTVMTGFDFSGADALTCLIGPGTYTLTAALAVGLFANPPSAANPLWLRGCNASGVALVPPDPDWVSAMPAWDDSTLPVITTTTNISTLQLANTLCYLLKLTASGRNGAVVTSLAGLFWCVVINSTANTAAIAVTLDRTIGCVLKCTGTSYASIISAPSSAANTRIEGVTGSSGNRHGISGTSATFNGDTLTVVNCGGDGLNVSSASVAQAYKLRRCVIANNGGTGIKTNSTASQTAFYEAHGCIVTGHGAFGIDAQSAGRVVIRGTRLRDNVSGNTNGLGNYPTDLDNYTTDSDDATEYVNTGSGDYRIKNTASAIWGKGYGAGDEPVAGGGGLLVGHGMSGGMRG